MPVPNIVANIQELRNGNFAPGSFVMTAGYHQPNDGGNGLYLIRQFDRKDEDDGGLLIIGKNNAFIAELIHNQTVNIKQYGCVPKSKMTNTLNAQHNKRQFKKAFAGLNKAFSVLTFTPEEYVIELQDYTYGKNNPGDFDLTLPAGEKWQAYVQIIRDNITIDGCGATLTFFVPIRRLGQEGSNNENVRLFWLGRFKQDETRLGNCIENFKLLNITIRRTDERYLDFVDDDSVVSTPIKESFSVLNLFTMNTYRAVLENCNFINWPRILMSIGSIDFPAESAKPLGRTIKKLGAKPELLPFKQLISFDRISNCYFEYGGGFGDLCCYSKGGVTFDNCIFYVRKKYSSHTIYLGGAANNVHITNCKFYYTGGNRDLYPPFSIGGKQVVSWRSSGNQTDNFGLFFQDNYVYKCHGAAFGTETGSGTYSPTITGNEFIDTSVNVSRARNAVISNNKFKSSMSLPIKLTVSGGRDYDEAMELEAAGSLILGNTFFNGGIDLKIANRCEIRNNHINTLSVEGIDLVIADNVIEPVIPNGESAPSLESGRLLLSSVQNCVVRDNNFICGLLQLWLLPISRRKGAGAPILSRKILVEGNSFMEDPTHPALVNNPDFLKGKGPIIFTHAAMDDKPDGDVDMEVTISGNHFMGAKDNKLRDTKVPTQNVANIGAVKYFRFLNNHFPGELLDENNQLYDAFENNGDYVSMLDLSGRFADDIARYQGLSGKVCVLTNNSSPKTGFHLDDFLRNSARIFVNKSQEAVQIYKGQGAARKSLLTMQPNEAYYVVAYFYNNYTPDRPASETGSQPAAKGIFAIRLGTAM
jgi:hypothetical protein